MGKAANTKQFIIEKIAPVFNKKGYLGTTLSDLIAATGLTKGALYAHFDNKEQMAMAALEYNIAHLLGEINQYTKSKDSCKERLLAFLDFYEYYYPVMLQSGGCVFMNTAVDCDDTEEQLFLQIRRHFSDWRTGIAQMVEEGQQRKEFSEKEAPYPFADRMIAMIEGGILLSKTLGSKEPLLNNINFLREYIAEMLA